MKISDRDIKKNQNRNVCYRKYWITKGEMEFNSIVCDWNT